MGWIIFGIVFFVFAFIISCLDDDSTFLVFLLCLLSTFFIVKGIKRTPTAMDLHAGKAVIKYEVIDGVIVDSTFVFKDN